MRGRGRLHAVRHGAGVRPRAAPDPDHRQRAHHRRRGSRVAVPVRLREDRVRRARARARAVEGRRRRRRRHSRSRPTSRATEFEQMVRTAKEYIAAGDIYQVVLSQRFEASARRRSVHRLPRAAPRQSVAVHVFPARRRSLDRRLVAGDAGPGRRAPRADAPDCRHAAARAERGRRHAAGRGAEAQREGARRARDARRPRTQRHRPRVGIRHGARADLHDARTLLARHAPGVDRRRQAGRSSRPARRAGRVLSRPAPCRARRRCGRWRSSRSSRTAGAASMPARWAIWTSRATSTSASRFARC